jgi:hypothetical protein
VTQSEVHQSLQDLNEEIERTQTDDEHKQTVLDDVKTRVQKVLDDPDGGHHVDLPESLADAAIKFEVEHPSLASAMQIAANSLSAMGM